MIMTARRLRSIGWMATLVVCAALVMVLAFRVNALRSQVHQSQARIIALKQETEYLETEFETRANQQQLKAWNDVDFGYAAPTAAQYLDNERQLASYAKPVEPDAPAPIRVASADDSVAAAAAFPAMVSPMTGKPTPSANDSAPAKPNDDGDGAPSPAKAGPAVAAVTLAGLSDRLGTVHHGDHPAVTHKPAKAKDAKAKTEKTTRIAKTDKTGKTGKSAKTPAARDKPVAKTHLASADAHHGAQHAIRLALKDAKIVK